MEGIQPGIERQPVYEGVLFAASALSAAEPKELGAPLVDGVEVSTDKVASDDAVAPQEAVSQEPGRMRRWVRAARHSGMAAVRSAIVLAETTFPINEVLTY